MAKNYSPSTNGNHQGGENPKQSSLAAAIRTQQPEQLGRLDIERHTIQCGAIVIAMDNVLCRNNRRNSRSVGNRRGENGCVQGHKGFYAVSVLIIMSMNNSGR